MVLTLADDGGVGTSDVKWFLPGLMVIRMFLTLVGGDGEGTSDEKWFLLGLMVKG